MGFAKKGFTLIELIIVVVIIGIIASVIIVVGSGVRSKSRDAKRKADLSTVKTALESYYSFNKVYPSTCSDNASTCKSGYGWCGTGSYYTPGAPGSACTLTSGDWIPNLVPTFIPGLPRDPNPTASGNSCGTNGNQNGYIYKSDGFGYKMATKCTVENDVLTTDVFYDPIYGFAISSGPGFLSWNDIPSQGVCSTQVYDDENIAYNPLKETNCVGDWTSYGDESVAGDDDRAPNIHGKDPITGLVWSKYLKNTNGTVEFTNSGGSAWSWDASGVNNIAVGNKTAEQLCSEQGNGWHLPSQKELMQAYIDGAHWNLTNPANPFWTKTQLSSANAWYVNPSNGRSINYPKTYQYMVRCVRRQGGCTTQNYEDMNALATEVSNCSKNFTLAHPENPGDDNRVGRGNKDPVTGLIWSKTLGNNGGVIDFYGGSSNDLFSWDSSYANNLGKTAIQLCADRGNGWRLPSQKEFMQAYIDGEWWNLTNNAYWFWTSTDYSTTQAWQSAQNSGQTVVSTNKSTGYHIRCVR